MHMGIYIYAGKMQNRQKPDRRWSTPEMGMGFITSLNAFGKCQ